MAPVKRRPKSPPPAVSSSTQTPRTAPAAPIASAEDRLVNSEGRGNDAIQLADQLHSAAIHLLRRLRVRDRESGIGPAQLSALSVLVFGGPKSLGELAEAEQVRPPTMSRIVRGLQHSGLLRRHETEDARRIRLEATPKGVALMWEGRQRRVQLLADAVAKLNDPERQQLSSAVNLLQRVLTGL